MTVEIRFLGTAAFEIITANGKKLLIDPYLDDNPKSPYQVADLERLDLLLVTHSAIDHLGDAEAILKKFPDLRLICGADVRGYLMAKGIDGDRLRAIPWGMMISEAGINVRPVYSRHWSYIQSDDGQVFFSTPLGLIVDVGDGHSVYHSGDTALYGDMKLYGELYKPTIGLMNVGVPEDHRGAAHGIPEYLTGEMDAVEAAMACDWWGFKYAIPCHHDNIQLPEIQKFNKILQDRLEMDPSHPKPILLEPGQTLEIDSEREKITSESSLNK